MKKYIVHHPWKIIEDHFDPDLHMNSESLFSLGNGRMGQRANFEEKYSGASLQGSYIAGIYYPDKTRVGWWKNGYPEYFAKVLNSVNWIGLRLFVGGTEVDLATCDIISFNRELDMKEGVLRREVILNIKDNKQIKISSERFYSLDKKDCCALRYNVKLIDFKAVVSLIPYLDFNISNSDANYDEDFWHKRNQGQKSKCSWVQASTRKTEFVACAAMKTVVCDDHGKKVKTKRYEKKGYVHSSYKKKLKKGASLTLYKYVAITSSLNHEKGTLAKESVKRTNKIYKEGYKSLLKDQLEAWKNKWNDCDITIGGDVAAQQGIRFNIFQLLQTYTGDDPRLNIGPKGFTGEKYGGSTYWDTEAYCLPFYMSTTHQEVGRNLLIYRYKHLQKAIENAENLGFQNGAALYPMVTMNGEECHNEWEITFEEIHRNGAIAYAIHDYIRYTGDKEYLVDFGLEVLISIARFWAQRVHVSPSKKQYVMHGVTGPNEYENNVNNNWYTNYLASWCLRYAVECAEWVKSENSEKFESLKSSLGLDTDREFTHWKEISDEMYYPVDETRGIFWQQEGFEDKEDITIDDLRDSDRPINQKWSWDRILRSPFIKQADVLQGIYFFEEDFSTDTIKRNFEYYEPKTVHESSLSPCVHSILSATIGDREKAYEMYVRTARLDLDDYNNDTEDGCHITSMAGTWLTIVKGFAGMRAKEGILHFSPFIPDKWKEFSFRIIFRGSRLKIAISDNQIAIQNLSEKSVDIQILDTYTVLAGMSEMVQNY